MWLRCYVLDLREVVFFVHFRTFRPNQQVFMTYKWKLSGSFPTTPRDGALNKLMSSDSEEGTSGARSGETGEETVTETSGSSGSFSRDSQRDEAEAAAFHAEVLVSVQRWFSAHGWPGGPHPITIPHSFRK